MQITLIALVLVAFVWQLAGNWADLSRLQLRLDYSYLALSAIPLFGRPFLSAFGWWQVVRKLKGELGIASAIHIYFISGLARYVPGPFLGSIGRALMAEEAGVPAVTATLSVLIELGLLVASGVILGAIWTVLHLSNDQVIYMVLLGIFSLILLNPRFFLPLLNRLLGRFKRKPIALNLHLGDMLQLLAPYLLNWMLNGLTFYLVLKAISPLGYDLFNIMGIYIVALTVAIFGLITPDGWGARELALGNMLVSFAAIPAVLATGLAIFTRVWWMVSEAAWVGLALLLGRGRQAATPPLDEQK